MITKFQLTPKSSNRKTGPIATIRSSSNTCPSTCPFNNGGGCYAASGPEAIHWRKLDKSEKPEHQGWIGLSDQFRAAKLKPGTLLRLNTAGDLPCLPTTGEIHGNMVDPMRANLQTRAVDQVIARLRKIIEPDKASPTHLLTIRDAGYRFITDPDEITTESEE